MSYSSLPKLRCTVFKPGPVYSLSVFDLGCLSSGGVGGNLCGCHRAGTGSWFGGGLGGGAAHCRLQDSVVITQFMASDNSFLIYKLTENHGFTVVDEKHYQHAKYIVQ